MAVLMGAVHTTSAQDAPRSADGAPRKVVPVAAHDIARGTVLASTDIAWSDSSTIAPGETFRVRPGWLARRSFRSGEVLREPGVSRPDLVTTGDHVTVVYSASGVTVQLRGTAVGSGAEGDEVYVLLENRRRLRGVVAAAGTVRVM